MKHRKCVECGKVGHQPDMVRIPAKEWNEFVYEAERISAKRNGRLEEFFHGLLFERKTSRCAVWVHPECALIRPVYGGTPKIQWCLTERGEAFFGTEDNTAAQAGTTEGGEG